MDWPRFLRERLRAYSTPVENDSEKYLEAHYAKKNVDKSKENADIDEVGNGL